MVRTMVKIAIPQLGDQVAPRFDVARSMLMAAVDQGRVVWSKAVECDGPEGYRRVRLLRIHQVTVLICGGINTSYRDLLVASGVAVIPKYSGTVQDAIDDYLCGRISAEVCVPDEAARHRAVPHEQLVEQARSLFQSCGYQVAPGPGPDAFLIDLVAVIECPVCHLPVRVAVCCGAHTYRADQEISEFHHATRSGYHARAYICPRQSAVWECCREYGIEPLDPSAEPSIDHVKRANRIPLLRGPVPGHERASAEVSE